MFFVYKIYFLQTSHDGYWKSLGKDLTMFQVKIEAERGNIFTEDGRILATTIPTFELRMDTKADGLTDKLWDWHIDTVCLLLAKYIPKRNYYDWKNYLLTSRAKNHRHLLLAKKIDFQTYKKIREIPLFRLGKNKSGLITVQTNTRKLPFDQLAKRSIGYVTSDGAGQVGIEATYNEELSGENREILMQKVAGGIYMPVNNNSKLGSKPGLDVYTTIDVNLQDITEESLLKSVTRFEADHGSAILMNVKTGAIKAIANIGKTKKGDYREIFNYAINELNAPGSVMKLASVMALLDEGYCDENTIINLGNGEQQFYDLILKDDHKIEGKVTLAKAFEVSSNVGISKPVFKYFNTNKKQFYNKLESYHLTKSYGLGILGESEPEIKPVNEWTGVTLPWISIGYELRMTPLQILGLYAAVANNGKLMKPYIVKEVRDNEKVIETVEPKVLKKSIAKTSTIVAVRKMLENVVDSGTASNIRNNNYKIAGKTGTNLIAEDNRGFSVKKYQASFVGYFPAKNPVYACIVVINKPNTKIGYYGRQVAAPVFKDIADRLYSTNKNIHPSIHMSKEDLAVQKFSGLSTEISKIAKFFNWNLLEGNPNKKTEWSKAIASNNKLVLKSIPLNAKRKMPNVVGLGLKDATFILESKGMVVFIEGKGKVKWQSIKPKEKIYNGSRVKLILG